VLEPKIDGSKSNSRSQIGLWAVDLWCEHENENGAMEASPGCFPCITASTYHLVDMLADPNWATFIPAINSGKACIDECCCKTKHSLTVATILNPRDGFHFFDRVLGTTATRVWIKWIPL